VEEGAGMNEDKKIRQILESVVSKYYKVWLLGAVCIFPKNRGMLVDKLVN
jgi:hypothetical protein